MPSIRILRLQKELGRVINNVFCTKIRDERLMWVTIRDIKLSTDMKYAKVYFNYTNQHVPEEVMIKLVTRASGVIKKEIASLKMMRIIPEFTFIYDNTADKVDRLQEVFNKIHEEDENDSE